MRLRAFALLACVAVVGMTACSEDPTEPGNQEPSAIVTNFSTTVRTVGVQFTITAYAIDKNNARIPGVLSGSSAGTAVRVDSVPYFPELQETRFFLTTVEATEGTDLTVTGHGLTKSVTVVVE